ncbi:MAG: hypothetical protein LQ351_007336 [Letrouitia transgressa]|nr:MAG: hypothetical protein LQ351_007336 [Letrouitia transgressa]
MATMITYATTITCVKISLLLLYRRIFSISRFRHVAALIGGLCVTWYLAAIFADIFQCRPFSAAFEIQNLFTPKCIDEQAYYRGIITSNVILDVLVLAIPIAMVWRLQLKRSQKVSLSCIFLLGGFACVASFMRIATIGDIQHEDLSYNITNEYIWSEVEPAAAIICACIPTYKPLFKGLNFSFLSALSSSRRRRTAEANNNMNDSNDDSENLQWYGPEGKRIKEFDGFIDDHRKLSKGRMHVVNIGMKPPKVYVREISDAV